MTIAGIVCIIGGIITGNVALFIFGVVLVLMGDEK